MTQLGIFGAGGCGRGILPLVRQAYPEQNVVFVDDKLAGSNINGKPVVGFDAFSEFDNRVICLAIADGAVRRHIAHRCDVAGIRFFDVCAAQHVRMDDVVLGDGALISPYTTLTSNIRIGRHFHLNLYAYVEHDCQIGDFVTFAPASCCNGNVTIGDGAYIGSNAVIRQGITIGAGAVVGMGAVVTKDVPSGETWVGNPARLLNPAH